MANIRRVRVDPQGIITQDEKGWLARIPLSREILSDLACDPMPTLRRISSTAPALAKLMGSEGTLDARLEIVDEDADCLNRPLRIYYGIEPRCNLLCRFCGPRDLHDKCVPASADTEDFVIAQIARAGTFQIQLTGGEISVRGFDLLRVLDKTREHGLAVILSTNGVLKCGKRKREFLTALAGYDHIIQSKISIEGTREFHDSVRGQGSYDEAVETLALLAENGLNPRISTTIFRSSCNAEQLGHLVGLAKTHAAGLQPIPLRPIGRASHMTNEVPSVRQLRAYTGAATRIRSEAGVPISFNFDIFDAGHQVPVFDIRNPVSCGAPLWGVHVTHTGEVFPCGFAQEVEKGKAFLAGVITREQTLLDIWLHSDVLRRVRSAGKDLQCRNCVHYGRGCWGGCWVMGWMATKRIDGMDPYCIKRETDR